MPPPPKRPIPGMPTRHVPWSAPPPRAATRSHPGTETSDRPPVGLSVPPAAPPSQKGSNGRSKVEQYGLAIGIVITALGGSAVLDVAKSCSAPKPATAEQADDIREEVRSVARGLKRLERAQQAQGVRLDNNDTRWGLAVGYECRRNGKTPTPYAREQECNPVDENGDPIIWETPPLGQQGPLRARYDWPKP